MKLLTKVASGVAYGDVSNQGIRNILTEISKKMGGKFTEQEMQDTLDHFGWKCPYTGRDLRNSIMTNDGSYATDHIYPQNKEWCGLNVKGNLVIVDRKANSKKRDMDIKTFMLTDTEVLGNLDMETRKNRLKKIEDFQKECGYDPEQIRTQISPILKARYDEIRSEQENFIDTALGILSTAGIYKAPTTIAPTASAPSSKSNVKKPKLSTAGLRKRILEKAKNSIDKFDLLC